MRKRPSTKMTALVLVLALALLLSGCRYKEEIAQAAALIEAIGTVTLESEDAILAAEDAFAALPEKARAKVENAAALTAARESYDEIRAAYEARQATIAAAQAQLDALETLPLEKLADIAAMEQAMREAEAACAALPEEDQAQISDLDAAVAAAQARIESEKPGLFYAALEIADEAQEWPMHEVYTLHLVSDTGEEKTVLARLSGVEDDSCRFSELFSDIELMRLSGYTPGEALPEDGVEVLEMHSFFAGYQLESLTAKIKPELPSPVEAEEAAESDAQNAEETAPAQRTLPTEEEIAAEVEKLGVVNPEREINDAEFLYMTFVLDGQPKTFPVVITPDKNHVMADVKYIFSDYTVLKIPCTAVERAIEQLVRENKQFLFENLSNYEFLSPYLNDAEEVKIAGSGIGLYLPVYKNGDMTLDEGCDFIFELIGLDPRKTNGTITYIRNEHSYTVGKIAEAYVKYIPEEYRVTAYDLNSDQYSRSYSAAEYAAWYLAAVPETVRVYAQTLRAVASP